MKLVLAFLAVGFCALAWAVPTGKATGEDINQNEHKVADKDMLLKQKKILSLFKHINQPSFLDEHVEIVKTFKLEENKDKFKNQEVVDKIIEYYTNGYQLPKGAIFSITFPEHLDQAIAMYNLFREAKDFDTFYKTAVVARHWINEGMFLYSFSVAVIHRPDCYGIMLPPIYEVYPYYFFDTKTIQQAYKFKQTWNGEKTQTTSGKYPGYTMTSNYSGHYLNLHPEQSLSYYLEDVGMSSFYYTYNLYYPFWMSGETHGLKQDMRGELFFFVYQQLFSRYYLERLSNGFGEINTMYIDEPVETPFYPSLQYPNGLSFPERPKFAKLSDYFYNYGQAVRSRYAFSYNYYKDFVRRIADVVDRGFAFDKQGEKVSVYDKKTGFNVLGNILQANADSPDNHYYGPWLGYGRHLMGYSLTPLNEHKVAPSALEHFETTLRDPGFYQLYKHLMMFYRRYLTRLGPYTREEMTFPGVSIEKVEMDRLITYFDEFYSDISQAVYYSEEELKKPENTFFVRAKQYRLNHKPFTYKIHVKSDKDTKAVVKIFIGPKYDEYGRYINISANRFNFFELDKFVQDLKTGDNIITRSSFDNKLFAPDKTSFFDMYKQVMGALEGQGEFTISGRDNYFNFPQRYMLPKGTTGGHPVQFYFIVYPFKPYSGNKPQEWTYNYPRPGVGGPYLDDYPLFYPFDRPIKYGRVFHNEIPNTLFHETKIYHKKDINAVLPGDQD